MEKRKLTKADIDKVRNIEGFPIAKDEDIIALSDAPYYTACPNPFIEEFIRENGKPYDEATDDYHREPFAADVSEGKHDPLYMAHSYHTKVPYKAIMRYVLHYTNPGDIIFDGFCGSGMTGVAAQMCGIPDAPFRMQIESELPNVKWGKRNAIINDLSPEATFIAYNYTRKVDLSQFELAAKRILSECNKECSWLYKTQHDSSGRTGDTNYTVWSDVYICPNCGHELILWDIAVKDDYIVIDKPICSACGVDIDKGSCKKSEVLSTDIKTGNIVKMAKQVPVKIFYTYNGKRYSKKVTDNDMALVEKIEQTPIPYWYPTDRMREGGESRRNDSIGVTHVHQFYTPRNLHVLAKCYNSIMNENDERIKKMLMFWFSSIYSRSHKLNRYMPNHARHVGPLSGTLYFPFFQAEINILNLLEDKLNAMLAVSGISYDAAVTNQSSTSLNNITPNSVDYIFTDPPFGDNLSYSELNFIWESWLRCFTNNTQEAVVSKHHNKGIFEYQGLMTKCFEEFYKVLKPNRWMTVEFHNSKNAVWNAIQEAIIRAGFIVADIRTLDKQKGTTKQLSTTSAVKQDLVISAYKPKDSFKRELIASAGSEETAWAFVRQHLDNLPVAVVKNGKIELITERQAFLLFDRMVAYHIMNGISVPLDATDFYSGLDEKFLKRDGMYFLADQVNEYDTARIVNDVEDIQFSLIVSNEKTAIAWLYQQLATPQTYAEIQPKFMQEIKTVDKYEAIPELAVLLEDSFLQDDKGKWYIPDRTKEADVAKLREKKLHKEFEGYLATKGKLKLFRTEAIRVGFAKLWADKNYKLIVETADRLPEDIIQEDDKLLMYYDLSLGRV